MVIEVDPSPSDEDVQAVIDGLVDFNTRHLPVDQIERVAVFVRDAGGRIRGGAVVTRKWNWAFVSHVWLEDDLQGRGLGRRLMVTVEDFARAGGCDAMHLETLDFQAKGFYERLGFKQFAELADYPNGHTRHFLWKRIT